jgi:glycosyltransferase involved in cell wall biosynthesis
MNCKKIDCGDLFKRLNNFHRLDPEEKKDKASEFFRRNDLEVTANNIKTEMTKLFQDKDISIVHVHNSFFLYPLALSMIQQNEDKIPIPDHYFWCHSPNKELILPNGKETHLFNYLERFQSSFKDIFAVSMEVKKQLQDQNIQSKLHYLGLDSKFFQKRANRKLLTREKLNLPLETFVILFTGRVIKEKGVKLFPVICLDLLKKTKKPFHFLIVGEGKDRKQLEAKIKEMKIQKHFSLLKTIEKKELVNLYSCADCFLIPSIREALGLSILEAMSCSLPVIASDLPGINEIITDRKNGFLIKPNDQERIEKIIMQLMNNPNLRLEIAKNARKRIIEQFDNQKHFEWLLKSL